jgi:dihydrodipicolinate synthase/N-acetylneuraminate lyase
MEVKIGFAPVTPANRLQKVASSDIGRYQVDAGRTVVVTAGTTNETALSTLAQKQRIGMSIVSDRLVVSNPKSKAN